MIYERISDNIPPQMKILNYDHPHSASIMYYKHFPFKKQRKCTLKRLGPWKATLRYDVEFATVYHRVYCRKFMTLANKTSHCICKYIRISEYNTLYF